MKTIFYLEAGEVKTYNRCIFSPLEVRKPSQITQNRAKNLKKRGRSMIKEIKNIDCSLLDCSFTIEIKPRSKKISRLSPEFGRSLEIQFLTGTYKHLFYNGVKL